MLLTYRSESEVKRLYGLANRQRSATRTPCSDEELSAQLPAARPRGYAISHSSYEQGIASVAAPVFGAGGAIVAAINVSVPDGAIARQIFDSTIRDAVCAAARAISSRLGYQALKGERRHA